MSADGPAPPARVLLTAIDATVIADRLRTLAELLSAAATRGGRSAGPEILVASKYFDPAVIPALIGAGATLLGENRAELIAPKQAAAAEAAAETEADATGSAPVQWDFIGELQSRKAAALAPQVARIHTLASESAVRRLADHADAGGVVPELLVQVNVAGEVVKGGVAPDDLPALLEAAGDLPVRGLMTMPPVAPTPDDSRRWFAALRELAAEHGLAQLSMGTSQDAVVAAEEGATVVRIGGILHDDDAWARLTAEHG